MKNQILVVDDDPFVLRTIEKILQFHDITVLTAESGTACIEIVKNGYRGLVLMDVSMPKMDGWQTIAKLKEEGLLDGLIISMLTAQEIPAEAMQYFKESVVDYITKPFDSVELVAIVKGHLNLL